MIEDAYDIVRRIAPGKQPDLACMLVAATVAGMRGLTLKHVKAGALFWPNKFAETDSQLSFMGGWGIACFSPSDGKGYLQDDNIDDDGGFRGHCWVESDDGFIIDPMHGVDCGSPVIYGDRWQIVARWYRRSALEKRIKSYWRMEMKACASEGRKWAKERAKWTQSNSSLSVTACG